LAPSVNGVDDTLKISEVHPRFPNFQHEDRMSVLLLGMLYP